jgi:hypothetical protein
VATLAIRLDFAAVLVDDRHRCEAVAEVLVRPCFAELERVSAHRGDRWIEHAEKSAAKIVEILQDRGNRAVAFDTKRNRQLVASGEIQNGTQDRAQSLTRFSAELVFPTPADIKEAMDSVLELAGWLQAGAGFVAVEPSYDLAHHVALGGSQPKLRPGLSERHAIERRGRDWHYQELATKLAGPEWGTFLGAAHLARLAPEQISASGAFYRISQVSNHLAFLQLTPDPADALAADFESKLQRARDVLAPIAMDLSDVNLR